MSSFDLCRYVQADSTTGFLVGSSNNLGAVDCFVLGDWSAFTRLLSFEDYNTRVVLMCVTLLGIASGVVGCFTLLRKRALLGDALAHSSLPGIAIAFMLTATSVEQGKALGWLLLGAAVTGVMGVALVLIVKHQTRLKEDVGLGAALSIFFGAGMALLGIVQQMEAGHAAGLEGFIYGKTASMTQQDTNLIASVSFGVILFSLLFYKEFSLLCFDEHFTRSVGFKPWLLDLLLMGLVVIVSLAGLQAVGLILVVALLVIPPAAARFWTDRLGIQLILAGVIGGLSGLLGGSMSAIFPRLPSGAVIVLTAATIFFISLIFGSKRGIAAAYFQRRSFARQVRSDLEQARQSQAADGKEGA